MVGEGVWGLSFQRAFAPSLGGLKRLLERVWLSFQRAFGPSLVSGLGRLLERVFGPCFRSPRPEALSLNCKARNPKP